MTGPILTKILEAKAKCEMAGFRPVKVVMSSQAERALLRELYVGYQRRDDLRKIADRVAGMRVETDDRVSSGFSLA